jgi:hypothetical protein
VSRDSDIESKPSPSPGLQSLVPSSASTLKSWLSVYRNPPKYPRRMIGCQMGPIKFLQFFETNLVLHNELPSESSQDSQWIVGLGVLVVAVEKRKC